MARDWRKKVRHGSTPMSKHVVNMGKLCAEEENNRNLYPGVRSDHLPPVMVFRSKHERREYFNQ